tara:strand:+ start:1719 stop:2549 length:831 start_codon:yes stop_codon:yes gene_type:complete
MSDNPLLSHMRQETVFVRLPSKGNFYKDPPDLTSDGEIGVRAMTSADELALKVPDALFNSEATYRVLQSCCPRIKDPKQMPYNDVDVVLMAIRRATYGNELTVPVECKNEKCKHQQDYIKEIDPILAQIPTLEDQYTVTVGDLTVYIRPIDLHSTTELQLQAVEQLKINDTLTDFEGKQEDIKKFQDSMRNIADSNSKIISRCVYIVEMPDKQRVEDPNQIQDWINNIDVSAYNDIMKKLLEIQTVVIQVHVEGECIKCKEPFKQPIVVDQSHFFA